MYILRSKDELLKVKDAYIAQLEKLSPKHIDEILEANERVSQRWVEAKERELEAVRADHEKYVTEREAELTREIAHLNRAIEQTRRARVSGVSQVVFPNYASAITADVPMVDANVLLSTSRIPFIQFTDLDELQFTQWGRNSLTQEKDDLTEDNKTEQ